ncbi:MAG TPA: DUF3419 family protein [Phycisphaerae bacterium]|jgi:S-adenosylmethionine:diacylglycerol 3-amino-3-carboxypropyl transferase
MTDPSSTPWSAGRLGRRGGAPQLLFGRMQEDWSIEAELFRPGARVFCIASAGCTALALAARGDRVTAVDINPVQIAYVRERIAGAPCREGRVESGLRRVRRMMRGAGLTASKLKTFLEMNDPDQQLRFWRAELDTRRWRALLKLAFHPLALRIAYAAEFLRDVPRRFDRVIRRRLERGWATHSNWTNVYAWRTLLGGHPSDRTPEFTAMPRLTLACADAVDFLMHCPPASFDGLTLSNMLDGTTPEYRTALWQAVSRAAAPGAIVILRSFVEPVNADEDRWAARDRALIWGSLRVERPCPTG